MKAASRLLIHIGYHKTATTWMQTRLFHTQHGYRQLLSHREVHDLITAPHSLVFDPTQAQAVIRARMSDLKPDEVPIISSEILTGLPFRGGRESVDFARRLKLIAPDARILASIRAQLKILPSVYMQYLLRSGTMTPRQFFTEPADIGYNRFSPLHYEYDRLLGYYQQLFGAENVFILQQERLRNGAEAAAADLATFCDNKGFKGLSPEAKAPHAPSYPEYAVPVLRRVNHFQRGALHENPILRLGDETMGAYRKVGYLLRHLPFQKRLEKYKPVSAFVEAHFAGYFDASNARLAEISGNPLDLHGY